jgi:uncharacterized surface protein with fasciclin (FAS1) repeats
MKQTCLYLQDLGKKAFTGLLLSISIITGLTSCNSDDVGGNLYTFTDQTMGQYFRNNPDDYSEFTKLLDTTKVIGLLNTVGDYTCFAPDNSAMKEYYIKMGKSDIADFSMDSLKQIAYDHIILGWVVRSVDFVLGRLPHMSMSDRYLSISVGETGDIYINKTSKIVNKDILVHNGVVHHIAEVLNPVRDGIVEVISKDPEFSLFYEALDATGLVDSLMLIEDETYNPDLYRDLITQTLDMGGWFYQEIPEKRKFGYTVLMESNATMSKNGITNLQSLKDYAASVYDKVYPADADITNIRDRHNSLNRFIAYHLITKQLSYSKIIDAYDTDQMVKTKDMYEYIETMCPNTLIEVCKVRSTNETNLLNRNTETGKVVRIVKDNSDNDALNGVYHEIDNMLVYDLDTYNMMSNKRLRFDSASYFDELTNNNMRGWGITDPNLRFQLPRGYINRISCTEQTVVGYLTGYPKYEDYEGDEIFLRASPGKLYDFVIETLPVPAGTYEVRFGYGANSNRGVAQLYFDGVPCGVPINLSTLADDPAIGYVVPHTIQDDYEGFENDKMMRNRGYMKAPAVFRVPVTGWFYGENARFSQNLLRRILGIYVFKTDGTHKLGVVGLSSGEFMFDYLEFVPTSRLETEDIY